MTRQEYEIILKLIENNTSKRQYPVGYEYHIPEFGIEKLKQDIKALIEEEAE